MSTYLSCRFCHKSLTPVLDLGWQPLANDLLTGQRRVQTTYPLILCYCFNCGLVQVPDSALPKRVFRKTYPYYSSVNTSYVEQCRVWAKDAIKKFNLTSKSRVLEIACNDGYLLKSFFEMGLNNLWGIEPVERIAMKARKYCNQFDTQFFDESFATHPLKQDLIICNNVLAHVPDLNGFIRGLKGLLSEHGRISVEVPDMEKLISNCEYDTIYHEHFSYFCKDTLIRVFDAHGLAVEKFEEIPSHGGSLRATIKHGYAASLVRQWDWIGFRECVLQSVRHNLTMLFQLRESRKKIAAFGAAAKGITFLNYLGIKSDLIDFCWDETPYKSGKKLPGSGIPIVSTPPHKVDYLLILPWNFAEEIIEKHHSFREQGGKFIYRKGEALIIV